MNNGRRYNDRIIEKAKDLRRAGLTHREIKRKIGCAASTAFLWTKGICLKKEQKEAIQERLYKATFTKKTRKRLSELAKINLAPYWKPRLSNDELLGRINIFFKENGRVPLKREFNNTYKEYRKRFGSWNKAVALAGLKPNEVIFSKKFKAKDGHTCDSCAEKIIDDWLFKRNIIHEKNLIYKGTKMTADFAVGKNRIEYFGLAGENKVYDNIIRRKRKACLKDGLKLIEIYPRDLFLNRLSEVIKL